MEKDNANIKCGYYWFIFPNKTKKENKNEIKKHQQHVRFVKKNIIILIIYNTKDANKKNHVRPFVYFRKYK